MHRNKIQPDIDVSSEIERNKDGIPTLESMVNQAEALIKEIINN